MRRCCLIAALVAVLTVSVSAYQIDSDYGVGTTNVTLFTGFVHDLDFGEHYLYWRNSRYEYCMAISSSLVCNGSLFTASDAVVITYSTNTAYAGQAILSRQSVSGFSLDAGNYLVYSDLGNYPRLTERRSQDYAKTACVILCSFMLYYSFHHLWADIRQRYLER